LDARLDHELKLMLADGLVKSPISYSALTTRLGLNSRSTLHTAARKEHIQRATALQFEASGTVSLKAQRRSQAERILELESRTASLQAALDQQIELMCRVVANATARGWDVEHLLQPLMPNNKNLAK
jgi:hypothetical protein